MWARNSGSTISPACFRRLTASPRWAVFSADRLPERDVKLALGRALYDPGDPMEKMFFNILAALAEFEADVIRMRTGEGMAIARDRGKLRGKQPKLSNRQQRDLCRIHATGEYSISDLAELFSVSRPIVYPHSTGALPLSVRSCPLPESIRPCSSTARPGTTRPPGRSPMPIDFHDSCFISAVYKSFESPESPEYCCIIIDILNDRFLS